MPQDRAEKEAGKTKTTTPHTRPAENTPQPKRLPPYRVLLHNDDHNTQQFVTATICQLTPLKWDDARKRMIEAHYKGVTLLLVTHKERAELYQEQFRSKTLTVTIEPDAA